MASSTMIHSLFAVSPKTSYSNYKARKFALTPSEFLSSKSFSGLQSLSLKTKIRKPRSHVVSPVFAVQSNFIKVFQTVWGVGRDGIEAGTNLVPDSVPRPVARISVTVVAFAVTLFVLKSVVSTVLFALGTMGLAYFIFIALNKDQAPRQDGDATSAATSDEEVLDEARRIMEKYK